MDPGDCLETLFRTEYGRIIAGLIRFSGSFDRAEEALQDAFAAAVRAWAEKGIPENPGGWITMTARRKLIDAARRDRTRRDKQDALEYETGRLPTRLDDEHWGEEAMQFPDDRLRLIFTCCHPALNREAQVALTLRTLSGLTTGEIAKAFLVAEPTMAQRLVRAKRKIETARIPYLIPELQHLPERVAAVQVVVYLIFNEGYAAASGDALLRGDLCHEAIRLGRLLCELLPQDRESHGLLALMLLHDARRAARVRDGELVTLEEQDRSLWDREAMAEGLAIVDVLEQDAADGVYHLQAAIAACHVRARTAGDTDWKRVRQLYARLLRLQDSPVVALNYAVAEAMSDGLEQGLAEVNRLEQAGHLENYYLLHAARADILRRMSHFGEAEQSYRAALELATNSVERRYLQRRLHELWLAQNRISST